MTKVSDNDNLLNAGVPDGENTDGRSECDPRTNRAAWLKLILGLWGVFLLVLIIFILCTKHIIG